jgi:hypothetical protein
VRYVELEFIAGCTRWRVWLTSFGHYTLGRHRDTDIRIPDRGVSRRHGRLSWTGEGLGIENLSESSGISVNRSLLRGAASLKSGDVLDFGSKVYALVRLGEGDPHAAEPGFWLAIQRWRLWLPPPIHRFPQGPVVRTPMVMPAGQGGYHSAYLEFAAEPAPPRPFPFHGRLQTQVQKLDHIDSIAALQSHIEAEHYQGRPHGPHDDAITRRDFGWGRIMRVDLGRIGWTPGNTCDYLILRRSVAIDVISFAPTHYLELDWDRLDSHIAVG